MTRSKPSSAFSASSAALSPDASALLAACAGAPFESVPWLMLEDWVTEFAPGLESELERWEAGTLTPAAWNAKFLPHYFKRFGPADFHADLDRDLHGLHLTRGTRRSYIAPRGGAKSTWCTLAYPLRAALEGWEPYTVILSDSSEQADLQLAHVRKEIEENDRIREVYGRDAEVGSTWKSSRLTLKNGCILESLGTGKKIRGRRNRSERPSLIIFDDIQSDDDVASPVMRDKAWRWATRSVMPAGDERTNFLAVGSALHRDAVAVRIGQQAGWQGRTFRAVHQWPHRMDLWAEFERLATNLADAECGATAAAFYANNRAAMDAGAAVYWPEKWPILALMLERARIGHSAFDTEYQGVPGTLEGAEWPSEYFDWPGFWFDEWPEDIGLRIQSLDPSKGRDAKSGDHQAHALLGVDRAGTIYVDCDFRREPDWCRRALDLAAVFMPRELVAESNSTMGLMIPEMHRLISERPGTTYRPHIQEVSNTDPKPTRIRVVSGYLQRKQIRVRNTTGGRILVNQWRDFPNGDHDDGPDGVATGVIRLQQLYHGVA